jgi:hypothetical protein
LTRFKAPKELCRGISAKKLHEISILTPFIINLCENHSVSNVIDIGSGLSYLGQFLALNSNIQIIGLESDENRVYLADKRLENQLDVKQKVKNVTFKLHEDCEEQLMDAISENSSYSLNLGLISLHSCGDLTPQMLKLFVNQSKFKFLAAFSCCYHSMKLDLSNKFSFIFHIFVLIFKLASNYEFFFDRKMAISLIFLCHIK